MDAEQRARAAFEAYLRDSGLNAEKITWDTVPEMTRERWRRMTSKMLSRGTRV